MLDGQVVEALRAAVGAGGLLTEPTALRAYECDGLTGHRVVPAAVVLPGTTEQVAAVVRACHRAGVPFVALNELLRTSDVVSIHVALSDRTRGLIGAEQIALMRPGALIINTARGAIVDNHALADALNRGHLDGAGIDVFDMEPVPADHPLVRCEQVVLTPHNADQTPEGMDILNGGSVDNVIAFLEGKPQNRVV